MRKRFTFLFLIYFTLSVLLSSCGISTNNLLIETKSTEVTNFSYNSKTITKNPSLSEISVVETFPSSSLVTNNSSLLSVESELPGQLTDLQEDARLSLIATMLEQGLLNPDTLEFVNPDNSFSTQSFRIKQTGNWWSRWNDVKTVANQLYQKFESADKFISSVPDPLYDKLITTLADAQGLTLNPEDIPAIRNDIKAGLGVFVPTSIKDGIADAVGGKIVKAGLFIVKGAVKLAKNSAVVGQIKTSLTKGQKAEKNIDKANGICKSIKCSSSFKLGENIFDAPFNHLQKGLPKPKGWQSHHIVPENHSSPFAKKSRDLLEKYGIDYKTSAYNGVNLPKGKLGKNYDADPNFPDVINHSETFKKEYPEKVLKRLEDSIDGKPEGDRKEILQNELKQMGEDILIGNKFW